MGTICEWVERKEARERMKWGGYTWGPRCESLILQKRDDMPKVDDESCRMGPNVSEANADGKNWAMALVAGWKPSELYV
jgi:hypothetical protein